MLLSTQPQAAQFSSVKAPGGGLPGNISTPSLTSNGTHHLFKPFAVIGWSPEEDVGITQSPAQGAGPLEPETGFGIHDWPVIQVLYSPGSQEFCIEKKHIVWRSATAMTCRKRIPPP
jgi:hypothetical protein